MKVNIKSAGILVAMALISVSCQESFFEQPPQGVFSKDILTTRQGLDGVLTGAYSLLDGVGAAAGQGWESSGSNWIYGSVTSDEAYKGSDAGDQSNITLIERFEGLPTNPFFNFKWIVVYDGVSRSNDVLRLLPLVPDVPDADRKRMTGEALFLRGHYHFEAKRMWNKVPYLDEKVTDPFVTNDQDIWSKIEQDFKTASENLPETQAEPGRATKWAATAYLAKVYLYQQKYADALPLLEAVIRSGKYQLNALFADSFNPAKRNSKESVFSIQYSANDGAGALNASAGDVLNFPNTGGPGACCGFFQPSQNLVNSYKTDANGLPMPDAFNATDVKNDMGIESKNEFIPETGALDSRLDWTVGRRGIPYLDWGLHPGRDWIRDQSFGGPYSNKKKVYYKSQAGTVVDQSGWTPGFSATTYMIIRYADVLLMAAECEVEAGSLEKARGYVNQLRARAANPAGFVQTSDGKPAANYVVKEYPAGSAVFSSKEPARKAVRFERKLELAMEGHRFFDLVRWGIADQVLNDYFATEGKKRVTLLGGAKFEKGKHEYFPIPNNQIIASTVKGKSTLTQNPGY